MTFSQTDFQFFSHFPLLQVLRRLSLEKMLGEGGFSPCATIFATPGTTKFFFPESAKIPNGFSGRNAPRVSKIRKCSREFSENSKVDGLRSRISESIKFRICAKNLREDFRTFAILLDVSLPKSHFFAIFQIMFFRGDASPNFQAWKEEG